MFLEYSHQRGADKKELEPMIPLWRFNQDASLAAGASDYIHVMDVQTGEHKWGARSLSWVTALAFSPAGDFLATGHEDGKARLWDLKNKKTIAEVHLSKLGLAHWHSNQMGKSWRSQPKIAVSRFWKPRA